MKRVHELKTDPAIWKASADGLKTFEIRFNDRDYQVGDDLLMRAFDREKQEYTGEWSLSRVQYILTDTKYGMQDGYVILATKLITNGMRDGWRSFKHIVACIVPPPGK